MAIKLDIAPLPGERALGKLFQANQVLHSVWDIRGLRLAREVAHYSKDPSTAVGAYVADKLHRPVSFGYNGFPRGISDDHRLSDREQKLKIIVHAEANAIFNANSPLQGCTLYSWPVSPCPQCASFLIQNGIARIVAPDTGHPRVDLATGRALLTEAGIAILLVPPEAIPAIP